MVTSIVELYNKCFSFKEQIAIIGTSGITDAVARHLSDEVDIISVIEIQDGAGDVAIDVMNDLSRRGGVDTIVVASDSKGSIDVNFVVEKLKITPMQIVLFPEFALKQKFALESRLLGGVYLPIISRNPLRPYAQIVKNMTDRVVSLILLMILFPVMVIIYISIKIETPGPGVFHQTRSGWAGEPFTIFKFRSMEFLSSSLTEHQSYRNDNRITRVGAFLRSTSLDELPQLINVLRGEMSLVGPRPHAETLHERERTGKKLVADYAQRYRMKPGMTGWAQVHGARGAALSQYALRRRVAYDLYYIDNWSFFLDFWILLVTPFCVIRGENAW